MLGGRVVARAAAHSARADPPGRRASRTGVAGVAQIPGIEIPDARGWRRSACSLPVGASLTTVGPGVLFALSLPGLVVLLVVVAALEQLWSRLGRPSPVHRRRRSALSAGGLDVFSVALDPGRAADLEEQRSRAVRRVEVQDGDPPWAAGLR